MVVFVFLTLMFYTTVHRYKKTKSSGFQNFTILAVVNNSDWYIRIIFYIMFDVPKLNVVTYT